MTSHNKASFDLSGRTALITGSTKGIGYAIARSFADARANIVLNGIEDESEVEEELEALKVNGNQIHYCKQDLSQPNAADHLFREATEKTTQIDILISNASVQCYGEFLDVTEEEMDFQFATNYKASFRLTQLALPGMRERGWGRILSIGSVQEENSNPNFAVYGSLKAAQTHFVRSLAKAFSKDGVTFNNIAPGVIDTYRNSEMLNDPDRVQKFLSRIPNGNIGQPEDCAGAALLICSDAGKYINGVSLFVDGGLSRQLFQD